MNTTELTDELGSLMELKLEKLPSVQTDQTSAPRRLIDQLVRQNYIPSYRNAPDDLKWLVEGRGDCEPGPSIHIIDLLGIYQSRNNKVILYDLLIRLCALQLKVDYEGLRRIVLLHELSHAVTHRGLDSDDKIWECFDVADKEAKEYFAQIYTYKFLQDRDPACLDIMNKLSEVQSGVYQTYKDSIDKDVDMINKELLEARRTVPHGNAMFYHRTINVGHIENYVWEQEPQGGNVVIVVIDDECGYALQDPRRIPVARVQMLPLLREYACEWPETLAIGFFQLLNTPEHADRMLGVINDWIDGLDVPPDYIRFLVDPLYGCGQQAVIAGPHTVSRLESTYGYRPEQIAYLTQAGLSAALPASHQIFGIADQTTCALRAGTNRFCPDLMSFLGL